MNTELLKAMTPAQLRDAVQQAGHAPYFFSRSAMRFFGDTMRNYGVRAATVNGRPTWELYRKRPVKYGLMASAYFDAETFRRVHL